MTKRVKYQNKPIFNDEFFKADKYDLYQLVKPDGDLFSYDEMAIKFKMTPNNHSFLKYGKLILAIPIIWLNENCTLFAASNFNEFKEKILTQIELLTESIKTVYALFREKSKVLPFKQQLKWWENLQFSSNFMNWKEINEYNYFSAIETKLRSFQIKLYLRSVVTNVQLAGFDIIDSEMCTFYLQPIETTNHLFLNCKIVEMYWKNVAEWISATLLVNFVLSNVSYLFGF